MQVRRGVLYEWRAKFFAAPLLLLALLFLATSYSFSQSGNFESITTGNWSAAGTWTQVSGSDADGVPDPDDNTVIKATHIVTIDAPSGCYDLTIEATASAEANGTILAVFGNVLLNGSFVRTGGNPRLNMNGDGTKTLDGTGEMAPTGGGAILRFAASTTILATANIKNNSTNPTPTQLNSGVTITNNGIYRSNVSGRDIAENGGGADPTWIQGANATVALGGTFVNVNLTASAIGNTVEYTFTGGAINIATPSASTYYHLTLSASSNKDMLASLIIDGNLTINGSQLRPGADNRNITIRGNWTNTGTFNPIASRRQQRVTFDGGSDQTITNVLGETFYRLTVNKGGGTLLLANDVNVNADGNVAAFDLTMSGGNINTQGNTITLGSSASGAGTLTRTAGAVIGKFSRWVNAAATNFTYPVGTASGYRPAVFNAAAGLTNGFIVGEHIAVNPGALVPSPLTDVVDNYYLTYNDGYWQLTASGAAACTNFNLDLDGTGFTAFAIENGPTHFTRVLKRVSGTWQAGASPCVNGAAGCPNGVAGNVVSRNLISGLDGDYAFVTRYNCTPPSAPTVSGSADVCINGLNSAYSCNGIPANTFTWSLPSGGGTIDPPSSGVSVQFITVDWGATGGTRTVRVVERNACSNSDPGDLTVTVHPVPTSSVTGAANVTEYTDGEPYSVTNTAGYIYTWTITGGSVASGQGTNSITVNWGAQGAGNVQVVATPIGGCPNDAPVNLPVTIITAYYSNGTGGGNWNVASTWMCNCVPSTSSSVKILNGDIVTRTANGQNIKNVTVDLGGTLITGDFTMTISGNLIVNGELQMSGATARTLTLSGIGATLGGTGSITATAGCGTKRIDITESKTIPSSANLTLTNVEINQIRSNVTVTNNGIFSINCDINGQNAVTSRWVQGNDSRLNWAGATTGLLNTGTLEASATGNTVNYNGTGNQTIKLPASSYYNLEVASTGGTVTIAGAPGSLTVDNNFTLTSGTVNLNTDNITVSGITKIYGSLGDDDVAGTNNFNHVEIYAGGTINPSVSETFTISGNVTMYGGSLTSSAGNPVYTIAGNLTVPSGTAAIGAGNLDITVSGTTSVTGTLTISSGTGTKTFNNIIVNSGGTWNNSANSPITVTGNIQVDGTGVFTSGSGIYTLSGASKTISGTAPGITITSATVTGSYSLNTIALTVANFTVTGSFTNNSTCNVTTAFDGGGTYTNAAGSTLNVSAATITTTIFDVSANCNLVNYNRTAADQTIRNTAYCNLQVATSAGASAIFSTAGATTVSNNFTIASGGIAAHPGTVNLTVSGLTGITGTLNFTTATTGTKLFNDVTLNAGGAWNNGINSPITINGNIQHDGTTFTSGTGLYTLGGAGKTISGTSGLSISDLTVSGTYTNNYTIASGCTLSTSGYSLAGAGGLTQAINAILYIGGNATITTLDATTNPPNTVYYILGQNPQNVKITTYHHLEISKSAGTANLTGNIQVNGNITISAGTLSANGGNNITLYGNWTRSGTGTFTGSTGTVIFTGTAAQTITGATTFNNLTVDKSSNNVTLNINTTISGTLTFIDGNIITGGNYCIISSTGSVSGAGAGTGWVQGFLQKNVATGGPVTRDYEVGGATVYAPANISFASVSVAGNFIVRTSDGDHPDIASSNIIPSQSLNRYWRMINSGVTFTTFNATYNFVNPGDLDGGVNPTDINYNGRRYNGFDWTSPGMGTKTATSTQVTGEPAAAYPSGSFRDLAFGIRIVTTDIYTRVTGAPDWNVASTWIQYRTGSLTFDGTVNVAGTNFDSQQLAAGDILMCQSTPGIELGAVVSVIDPNNLILSVPVAPGSCDYGRQRIPDSLDQIVYIGNPYVTSGNVDVQFTPVSAIINQLVFFRNYVPPQPISNSVLHFPGTKLTVQTSATVNQPNADGQTHLWKIDNGKVNINGSLTIGSNDATVSRVARVRNYTDSLTMGGGLRFRSPGGSNAPAVLDMTGGDGVVSVAGPLAVTLDNGTGTIDGGVLGSVFNYNGSLDAQTVRFGGAIAYNNLHLNNTHNDGAIDSVAITTTNVTGNIRVQKGIFSTVNVGITGNAGKTFEVVNTATFRMTGTATFPTGFGTYTFGPTSYTQYYQNIAQTIAAVAAPGYGHLHVEPTADGITHTFPATTTAVQSNLQIGNGTNTGVVVNGSGGGTVVDVNGDISIRANTTFSNSLIPSIFAGGNWTQNGDFTSAIADLVTFDGSGIATITSGGAVTFPNVTVNKSGGATVSTSGFADITTNNLTISGGTFIAPATLNINRTATSALTLNSGGKLTAGTTININGNWTHNTGGTFTEGTGMVNFTGGTTPQTINGTAAADTFYNVTVSKSLAGDIVNTDGGIVTVTTNNLTISTGTVTAPATLNINGNMLLASGQTFTAGTTIYSKGNWTDNGGTFTPGTNTVVFNGSGAQQINGTDAAQTFYNFTVTKTGGTLNVGGSATALNMNNTVTLNSGTFAAGTAVTINVTGNWTNNGGTFNGGAGTVFFINTAGAQLIDGSAASETFNNVTIDKTTVAGRTLTTSLGTITMNNCLLTSCNNFNTTGTATLNINGNMTLAGPVANTFTAGSQANVGGDWTNNGGAFIPGAGTVTFNGSVAQQINGSVTAHTFNNIEVAKTGGTTLTVGGSILTLNVLSYTNTSGNCNFVSAVTLNTFNVTSNVLLTAGTFTAGTNTNVGGNWTNNGSTFAPGSGSYTVTFNGGVAQVIGGSASAQTFNNVSKSGASTMSTGGSLTDLTFNGYYAQGGGNFNASTLTTLTIGNLINHNAGTFTAPAGTIVKKAGNWNTNAATFSHNNGTVQFDGTLTLIAGGGSVYSFNNVSITGGVTTAPSAVNMNVAGNWTNNSTFTHNSGTVTLNGTTAQTVGGTTPTTFNNLTVNNSYPVTAITLAAPITVNDTLNLTFDGHVITDAVNVLAMGPSSTVTLGAPVQDSTFVKGPMRHSVNVSSLVNKIYPIGKDNSYRRMELNIDQNTVALTAYTAEMFNADATNGGCTSLPGTIDRVSKIRYYDIVQAPSTALDAGTGIRMYFGCSDKNDAVTDLPNLVVAKANCPAAWTDLGGATGGTSACGAFQQGFIDASFTSFSRFALGNKTGGGNPLPVELLSFTATLKNNIVDLEWITSSETNNDFFTVEKSNDGLNFETLTYVDGAGNSVEVNSYRTTDDNPFEGINYYRLRQTDFDGTSTYSHIAAIEYYPQKGEPKVVIYPNPVKLGETLNIELSGFDSKKEVLVVLLNTTGQNVFSKVLITGDNGFTVFAFDPSGIIPPGVYIVTGSSDNRIYSRKMVVK